ncbi:MAG: Clp1/GlmU family protein [Desulfobacterota bacterium]|nr:Clp1/GlmU family protein [Thermodesulfobacteriota bacterium]MDW8001665.1 Clp1/GlmU family protein [Deltaproteobacteria bacterium]
MLSAHDLLSSPITLKGIVMVIGAPDTGKTYLCRELFKKAKLSQRKVSLLDLDVGQQSLAYPGTVALTYELSDSFPNFHKMRFVGTINPFLRLEELIEAARSLLSYSINSDLTIVDTSGLVAGEQGRVLKTKKANALLPDLIIAIQKENELEHILKELKNFEIIRVSPSSLTQVKTRDVRIRNRTQKLVSYFSLPQNQFSIKLKHVRLKPDGLRGWNLPPGRIIGLNSKNETVALGLLEGISRETLFFSSPLPIDRIGEVEEIVLGERGLDLVLETC